MILIIRNKTTIKPGANMGTDSTENLFEVVKLQSCALSEQTGVNLCTDDVNALSDVACAGEQGGDGGGGELEQPDARRARVPRQVQLDINQLSKSNECLKWKKNKICFNAFLARQSWFIKDR